MAALAESPPNGLVLPIYRWPQGFFFSWAERYGLCPGSSGCENDLAFALRNPGVEILLARLAMAWLTI